MNKQDGDAVNSDMNELQPCQVEIANLDSTNVAQYLQGASDIMQKYTTEIYTPALSRSLDSESQFIGRSDALIQQLQASEKAQIRQKTAMLERLDVVSRSLRGAGK